MVKSLAKGLRLKRIDDAEEGYQSMLGIYGRKIYPSVDGVRNVIRFLGVGNEKSAASRPRNWWTKAWSKDWKRKAGSTGPDPIA